MSGKDHSPARRRAPVAALHPGRCWAWVAGRLGAAMLAIALAGLMANGGMAKRADTPPANITASTGPVCADGTPAADRGGWWSCSLVPETGAHGGRTVVLLEADRTPQPAAPAEVRP